MYQCWQHLCTRAHASTTGQPGGELSTHCDNLCLCILHVAQGTRPNQADVGWAMHAVGWLATEQVQKANPMCQDPLSSVSTKNTLCDSTAVHAQYFQPCAHAQNGPASFLNKIRQT